MNALESVVQQNVISSSAVCLWMDVPASRQHGQGRDMPMCVAFSSTGKSREIKRSHSCLQTYRGCALFSIAKIGESRGHNEQVRFNLVVLLSMQVTFRT